jgi:pyridinium-3,5-bisthiocarboxylic acid mononucleotide nickel chelatase
VSRTLHFDCFAGASGDMVLGALLDVGLPLEELRTALGSLAIEGHWHVHADRVLRAGISATKFTLHDHAHAGRHEHPEHPHPEHQHPGHSGHQGHAGHAEHTGHHEHRSLAEIEQAIGRSGLSATARQRAIDLFRRLGEAEAAIHQVPIEKVHLHEVGALDSIVDIVGAVFAMEWFGIDDVTASALNVGGGMVECAHGTFPVPAPATARLLTGVPTYSSGTVGELVTPTGALLLGAYAKSFGPMPPMRVQRIGYGAGDRDPAEFPNVLRVFLGERVAAPSATVETIVSVECEIDDMNPQIFGTLMDRLHAAGALDVFYAPVQMKKNRPGTLVTVLAPPDRREAIAELLFAETTTIGVRWQEMTRERLERETISVATPLGEIRVKVARRAGRVVNAQPEFDDCARVAEARGVPIKEVQALALQAYRSSFSGF